MNGGEVLRFRGSGVGAEAEGVFATASGRFYLDHSLRMEVLMTSFTSH